MVNFKSFTESSLYITFEFECCEKSFLLMQLRDLVADFAMVIAIALMTGIDLFFALRTPKLFVPDEFKVRLKVYLIILFIH